MIIVAMVHSSIKYVATIIILSPVIGKLRDLAPGGNFSTLHDFKMVLGKNETRWTMMMIRSADDWKSTH